MSQDPLVLRTGPYVAESPLVVVVAVEKASRFGVSDASRAIQSMILTAWEAGVGSNWVGFGELGQVASMLEVPNHFNVLAVLPFGYLTEGRFLGRKDRKALSQVASMGRFGQPFQ